MNQCPNLNRKVTMDTLSGVESIPVIDLKDLSLEDVNSEGKCESLHHIILAKKVNNVPKRSFDAVIYHFIIS